MQSFDSRALTPIEEASWVGSSVHASMRLSGGGLAAGFSVVQIAMLPVEPCVAELMGKNVPSSRNGESLADIDRFGFVIPYPIRVGILAVHLRIGDLPDHNMVPERKDDFVWYSHCAPHCLSYGRPLRRIHAPG